MFCCRWLVSALSVLLHLIPEETSSHFSSAAREAREMLIVCIFIPLLLGTILLEFLFLFITMIELYFYKAGKHTLSLYIYICKYTYIFFSIWVE